MCYVLLHLWWGQLNKFMVGFTMNVRKENTISSYFENTKEFPAIACLPPRALICSLLRTWICYDTNWCGISV